MTLGNYFIISKPFFELSTQPRCPNRVASVSSSMKKVRVLVIWVKEGASDYSQAIAGKSCNIL